MRLNSRAICLVGMALFAVLSYAFAVFASDAAQVALQTKEQALQRALAYSGFMQMPGFVVPQADSCVQMMAIKDSTTPFLSDSISGAERWVVTFDSVFLELGGWSAGTVSNQIRKTYNFVLEPSTGRLLKVFTTYHGPEADLLPMLPADSATVNLSRNERHVSLVDSVPPLSFYEALDVAAPSNPLKAKEIQAWLVMFSHHGADPVPCWIILGRGTAPFPLPSAPSLDIEADTGGRLSSTSIRCIINAVTGKGLFFQG